MNMARSFVLLVLAALALNAGSQGQERVATESASPSGELLPGFTLDPRQVFSLDVGGAGGEARAPAGVELNGRTLSPGEWSSTPGRVVVSPATDLKQGLNRITFRYAQGGETSAAAQTDPALRMFYVNHQRVRHAVGFGDRGELIVDGKALFALAGYRSGQDDRYLESLPSAAKAGFTLVHDYRFEEAKPGPDDVADFVKDAREYLRRARQLGLGVFLGLPRGAARRYDEAVLATIVASLSNEPALWMWYVYDEPTEKTLTVETASRLHKLLRRLDPGRPALILANSQSSVQRYHAFSDVLWFDRYPFAATSKKLDSLALIASALQGARDLVPAGKPVWPVLQVHDNRGSPSLRRKRPGLSAPTDATHHPSVGEIRAESHVAIARGAMGLAYYWAPESWYSMKRDTPRTWEGFSGVLHELAALEPVLLSREPVPPLKIRGGEDKVMSWSRRSGDEVYVGLVNASLRSGATVEVSVPFAATSLSKHAGDGTATLAGKVVRARLGPAGVVVFSLSR